MTDIEELQKLCHEIRNGDFEIEGPTGECSGYPVMVSDNDAIADRLQSIIDRMRSEGAEKSAKKPIYAVPVEVAYNAVAHVGSANYQSRQDEANEWIDKSTLALYIAPPVPEGMVMVPREPTIEMMDAAESVFITAYTGTRTCDPYSVYKAMIAAAEKQG